MVLGPAGALGVRARRSHRRRRRRERAATVLWSRARAGAALCAPPLPRFPLALRRRASARSSSPYAAHQPTKVARRGRRVTPRRVVPAKRGRFDRPDTKWHIEWSVTPSAAAADGGAGAPLAVALRAGRAARAPPGGGGRAAARRRLRRPPRGRGGAGPHGAPRGRLGGGRVRVGARRAHGRRGDRRRLAAPAGPRLRVRRHAQRRAARLRAQPQRRRGRGAKSQQGRASCACVIVSQQEFRLQSQAANLYAAQRLKSRRPCATARSNRGESAEAAAHGLSHRKSRRGRALTRCQPRL